MNNADQITSARRANEYRYQSGFDYSLSEVLSETEFLDSPEPEPKPAHPLAKIKETIKVVGKRRVITTFCGPFRI